MSTGKSLSVTMAAALIDTKQRGGMLARRPGGFWTVPGLPYLGTTIHYEFYVSTPTINALVARGKMEFTEWMEGRNGRFPVAVKLVENGQ